MALISGDASKRLTRIIGMLKTGFHWGYLPFILYLGFQRGAEPGMPQLTLASLLWA
jgi:import receptor subunit TOM7